MATWHEDNIQFKFHSVQLKFFIVIMQIYNTEGPSGVRPQSDHR